MAKKNEMTELGQKARAGRMFSEYLRAIGDERTELVDVVVSPDKSERRLVSKAEALARDVYKKALPKSIASEDDESVDEKLQLEYRKLIFERVEGKVGTGSDEGKSGTSIPDKVSEVNKRRLNQMAQNVTKEKKTP